MGYELLVSENFYAGLHLFHNPTAVV